MELLFGAVLLVYAFTVLRHVRGWQLLSPAKAGSDLAAVATVTVVVAIRNEAHGLRQFLTGLQRQTYPVEHWNLILIDDHSTDTSAHLAQQIATELGLANFTFVNQSELGNAHGKKAALQAGIVCANSTYILTTDADCLLPPDWISAMVTFAERKEAYLVSGPVAYFPGSDLFSQLQAVEFASLIGVGGASIALRSPNMCNGANLLFRKATFQEVGGYSGNLELASGDDEFLLHKISMAYPEGYYFLKDVRAIVKTDPCPNWKSLYQQRIRWAGKGKHYLLAGPKLLALTVALAQFGVIAALGLGLAGLVSWLVPVLFICCKFVFELFFFWPVLRFFGLQKKLWLVGLLQLLYPPFVLAVALGTLTGRYSWKGRQIINP